LGSARLDPWHDHQDFNIQYPTGQVKASWGSQTNPTFQTYDYAGRLKTLHTWQDAPDLSQLTATPPDDSVTTRWQYHPATGLLTGKFHDYRDGNLTDGPTYTHTPAGRLKTRLWKRNITTAYYYNLAGDPLAVNYSDGTPGILHTLDRLGRATTSSQGTLALNGNVPAVSNGSGISITSVQRSATYGYSGTKFTLDTETTDLGGGFQKTLTRHYDEFARPRSLSIAGDYTTAYGYGTAGRLSEVWDHPALTDGEPSVNPTFTYGYLPNSANLLHTLTKAAGGPDIPALVATRTWEPTRDVLEKIENTSGQNVHSSYTYTVNSIGQRKAVATAGTAFAGAQANWSWDYDTLGQLEKAASGTTGNKGRRYQYDSIGNRLTSAVGNWNETLTDFTPATGSSSSYFGVLDGGTPSAPGGNALNQYAAIRGQIVSDPSYDFDGNMTAGPVPGANGNTPGVQPPDNATHIGWDAENRLISMTITPAQGSPTTYKYEYDHLSRLVVRKTGNTITRRYIYDGWNRIAEYDGTATTPYNTYTWGLDLSGTMQGAGGVGGMLSTRWASASGAPTYYPQYDGNGNISEYLAMDGTVAAHYEYDPFGTLTRRTGTIVGIDSTRFEYRFSTKPRDINTGLYYYGYRWYDPVTGRWPSRDRIEEEGGMNLYGFVGNSGVNWVDILGERALPEYVGWSQSSLCDCPITANITRAELSQKATGEMYLDFIMSFNLPDAKECDCLKVRTFQLASRFNSSGKPAFPSNQIRRARTTSSGWRIDWTVPGLGPIKIPWIQNNEGFGDKAWPEGQGGGGQTSDRGLELKAHRSHIIYTCFVGEKTDGSHKFLGCVKWGASRKGSKLSDVSANPIYPEWTCEKPVGLDEAIQRWNKQNIDHNLPDF